MVKVPDQSSWTTCSVVATRPRGGSRGFKGVEPLGNSVQVPYTSCYHCEDEVREGSVQSNHSELTSKTSTHLAFSALKWFEKVRGGSRGLNHSETVYRYPTHLVTTVKMRFEKVRYSRTTPNSRQRLLHTLPLFSTCVFLNIGANWYTGTPYHSHDKTMHTLFPLQRCR